MPRPKNVAARLEIKRIVTEERVYSPREIYRRLRLRGFNVSYSYVKVLLSRMRKEGAIERIGSKEYVSSRLLEISRELEEMASEVYMRYNRDMGLRLGRLSDEVRRLVKYIYTNWR